MTTKELKAQNVLTQCKLDDALAEIKELTALVEHMEKEKHNGIEIVAEPCPCTLGLFRIAEGAPLDMMYLHTKAVEYLKKERGVVYETDHIDENDLDRDIGGLAARIESMESDIREETEDAWRELVELYHDRIDPSRPGLCNKKGCNGGQAFEGETDGLLYCSPKCAGWSNDESDGD